MTQIMTSTTPTRLANGKTIVLCPLSMVCSQSVTLVATLGEIGAPQPWMRRCSASAKGRPLDLSQVHRIVKAAAARAGLSAEVSAHWLRHAHASHSLDRGAHLHLL